jgi:hypothetical protein
MKIQFINPFKFEESSWSRFIEVMKTTTVKGLVVNDKLLPVIVWSLTLGFRRYWFDYQNDMGAIWFTLCGFTFKYYHTYKVN